MEQKAFQPEFITLTDRQLLDAYSTTVTGIVKSAARAVVHIKISKKVQYPQTKKIMEQPGSGFGFVISTDGYIVTNNHVIEDALSIKAGFADGVELNADLTGADPSSDILSESDGGHAISMGSSNCMV